MGVPRLSPSFRAHSWGGQEGTDGPGQCRDGGGTFSGGRAGLSLLPRASWGQFGAGSVPSRAGTHLVHAPVVAILLSTRREPPGPGSCKETREGDKSGGRQGGESPQLHGDSQPPDTPWVLGSPWQVSQPSPTFMPRLNSKLPENLEAGMCVPLSQPHGDLLPLGEPWKDQYSDSEW